MKFLFRALNSVMDGFNRLSLRGLHPAPCYGDPALLAVKAAAKSGDWQSVRDALRANGRRWEHRDAIVAAVDAGARNPAWTDAWLAAEPKNPDAHLIRGSMFVKWAWEARGSGYAETVSKGGWRSFHDRLQQAMQILKSAAELGPDDPTPWAELLPVAFGLGAPRPLARQWFDNAVLRCPDHYGAHQSMLQFLCEKWHGSKELMWEFVDERTAAAQPGSDVFAIVPTAHFEAASALESDAPNPADIVKQYWRVPKVREGVQKAHRHLLEGQMPERETRSRIDARNFFANALWLCEAKPAARREFQFLRGRFNEMAWHYCGVVPARTFKTAQREFAR
jgi:hypothetical protein